MRTPLEPMEAGDTALERLIAREVRKLEAALALRRAAARRGGASASVYVDPVQPDFDGLVEAPEAGAVEWMEARLGFLRGAQEQLARAGPDERAYFWLGAACSFVGAVPQRSAEIRALEERVAAAAQHYRDVAQVTGGDEDEERLREEPWDGTAGLVPRRRLRGARILAEALELLAEQRDAQERLEERGAS